MIENDKNRFNMNEEEDQEASSDTSETPPGGKTATRSNRKSSKPIMEKRRRARINQSLGELKALILDAMKKDSSRHSKLEKADILEMTVKYLQTMQRQQIAAAASDDPSVMGKYRAGFTECAEEVTRYMSNVSSIDNNVKLRLLDHLAGTMQRVNGVAPQLYPGPATGSPVIHTETAHVSPTLILPNGQIISGGVRVVPTIQQIPGSTICAADSSSEGLSSSRLLGGLQVIPSRLPTGELAFIIPSAMANQFVSLNTLSSSSSSSTSSTTTQAAISSVTTLQSASPSSSSSSSSSPNTSASTLPCNNSRKQPGPPVKEEPVWRPW